MWYNLYHTKFSFYQIQVQDTIQGLVYCITCIVPTGALMKLCDYFHKIPVLFTKSLNLGKYWYHQDLDFYFQNENTNTNTGLLKSGPVLVLYNN